MFNKEIQKLENYNNEVQKFFVDQLLDTEFKTINQILDFYKLDLITRLTPGEFDVLVKLFPKTMSTLTNGCKPDYMPSWIKVNKNLKRKEKCNKHDFCYWIAWPRKASDKLFIKGMNQVCKGFGNRIYNYSFYGAVRAFGQTAFSEEEKTLDDFFMLEL